MQDNRNAIVVKVTPAYNKVWFASLCPTQTAAIPTMNKKFQQSV